MHCMKNIKNGSIISYTLHGYNGAEECSFLIKLRIVINTVFFGSVWVAVVNLYI
jgi:hypothetical protein